MEISLDRVNPCSEPYQLFLDSIRSPSRPMSAKIDTADNEPDKYAGMVLHYSHNAEKYIKENDYHKAGEMMWGAMSCVLKTVSAKRNKSINGHRALGRFAITLAKQDKDIFYSYSPASVSHQSFFESDLDYFLADAVCRDVAKTIGKLMIKILFFKTRTDETLSQRLRDALTNKNIIIEDLYA